MKSAPSPAVRSAPFQDGNGRWHGPDGRFIKVASAIAAARKAAAGHGRKSGQGSLSTVAGRIASARAPKPPKVPTLPKAPVVKKAASVAAPNDGLDLLDERQLKSLATEYELDTSLSRDDLIAALRGEGAISPALRFKRNDEYNGLLDRLKNLGRRRPADDGPLKRASEALVDGADAKTVAKQLRTDADGLARKEDADTLRFLANDLTRKKAAVPPYINDKGNIDLVKLAELNGVDISRWMPDDKLPKPGLAQRTLQYQIDHPFDAWFRTFVEDLGDPQTRRTGSGWYARSTPPPSRAKAIRLAREAADKIRKNHAAAVAGVGMWSAPNRTDERKQYLAHGVQAAADLEQLADLAAAAKVPPKKRAVTLGGTSLGEIVPIDEARFKSRPLRDVVTHRGQRLPADFQHSGSGTDLVRDRRAPKRPGLSDAETRALDLYTVGVVADGVNGSLRRGANIHGEVKGPTGTVDLDQVSRDLDSAIADSKLTQDTVLWRGTVSSTADYRRLVPGAVYTDLGYLSTSADEQGARQTIDWRQRNGTIPAGRKPLLFKILAPAGTSAAVGHERVKEAILPRGQELRVVRVDDAVTPPVVVMEVVPRHVEPGVVRGRSIVEDFDYDGAVKGSGGFAVSSARGDAWLGAVQKAQGYDGKPRVVTRQEMDDAVSDGGTEVFRAVRSGVAGRTSAHLTEEYRTGDLYPGTGVYGSGTYTSPQRETAKRYGDEATMLRIALRRDAKIISYADLLKLRPRTGITASAAKLADERQAELDKVDPTDTAAIKAIIDRYAALAARQGTRSQIAGDLGRVAALLGYDAIYIPADYRGAGAKMDGQAEYVILNRTATIVEEASK